MTAHRKKTYERICFAYLHIKNNVKRLYFDIFRDIITKNVKIATSCIITGKKTVKEIII